MRVNGVTPILNVSNIQETFAWFERLGWKKIWDWGDPPDFGSVGCGGSEIFLCENGQGGRRSRAMAGAEAADQGVWMTIWVDDVDRAHQNCLEHGLEITYPPSDEPWNVREMHVRHPDGHVFRISQPIEEDEGDEEKAPPLPIERVDVPLRLEKRLAGLLRELAAHKGMTLTGVLEETLLHSFEQAGGGVASPHTARTLEHIQELKAKHGIDYDTHASSRFVEK